MASHGVLRITSANRERATLRVGDVFVKIDADQARTDVEVEAIAYDAVSDRTPRFCRWPPLECRTWVRALRG